MKIQKGDAGYLRRRKRLLILEAVVSFGLVAALVIAGYVTTKTKLNLLTRMSSGKPDPGQSDHGHAARFHR